MQFSQKRNLQSGCSAVKFYTPPKLHTGKDRYVDFYASDLMSRIFEELQAGWNPWIQAASGATYSTLRDACEAYEAYLSKLLQEDLLREKTCKGYRSYLNIMLEWNASQPRPKNYIYQVDHTFCVRFLDWIWLDKGLSSTTRDNYLNWLKHFAKFLLEKQYVSTDITAGISSLGKKKSRKNRSIIAKADMARLKEFAEKNNRHFLLACYILYYCFIRPKEMSYIQLKHISVKRGTIFIPDYSSKNRKDGTVTLHDKVLKLMTDLYTPHDIEEANEAIRHHSSEF